MQGLYTGLALWNLAFLAVATVLGALAGEGLPVSPTTHRTVGFAATLFSLLVQSILVTHFIGTMKWIQQIGPTAGVDDTKALRRAWIKGRMFPTVMAAMLATVAAAILGASARDGIVGLVLHGACALAAFPLHVLALLWGREGIAANRARMQQLERQALERQAQGLVREAEVEALRPESGRAGGRTLLFLAANVWVLWFYRRYVLRLRDEPWWPYAAACTVLVLLGLALLRRWRGADGAAPPAPPAR
jgi:hypothetical protein